MRPAATTALLGLTLALAAGLFDAEPLWVPAFALVALSAGAVLWVLAGARTVRVSREVGARRVMEDEPVDISLEVSASGAGIPTGCLDEPLLADLVPLAAGRRHQRQRVRARFARRGRRILVAPQVIVRDPLGLATRAVSRGAQDAELLVLPRVFPVTAAGGPGEEGAVLGARGRPRFAAQTDLDGVRNLRPGTPAGRIFWPSLARGGELMERRLSSDADSRPLVVLDPCAGEGAGSEVDLDAAVRAAASLIVHLARTGGCAALLPGDRRPVGLDPSLGGWPHLHARLALVDGRGRPSLPVLAGRRGPVLYVAARRLAGPPRTLLQAGSASRFLVVPCVLPARRASFTVAGCTGYALPAARAPAVVA